MPRTKRYKYMGGFSAKERDRRWQNTRKFLKDNELDALLIVGSTTDSAMDRYLSNWSTGTVIFPLKGEPVLLAGGLGDMLALKPDIPEDQRPWIKDVRTGARGAMIVAALKEKGLDKGRIGVIGAAAFGNRWEGWIPYGTWERVVKRLTDCELENVGPAFGESILAKSEEELVHVRRAAECLEHASAEMLKIMRPGVSEYDLWYAISKAQMDYGSEPRLTQLGSGPNTVGPRPLWLHGIGPARVLQAGDVVVTELMADSRGYEAQVQMCAAIAPVSSQFKECARLARLSYEAGLRALRPGKTFEQVEAAMAEPLERPGVWFQTPLLHSMNPHILIGRTGVHIERMPGVEHFPQVGTGRIRGGERVIEPGMTFQLEPDACIGMSRVLIGGNVVVHKDGVEELNKLPTRMQVVG
ncbi:MAG: aminopeptidase P family protein [Chloroflexi bacterium]|nr:aminopeptidase P family protein [Chloroflexota bacterium]